MAFDIRESDGKVILAQTRRAFRIVAMLVVAAFVLGCVELPLLARITTHTVVACDEGLRSCTLTLGRRRQDFTFDSIRSVQFDTNAASHPHGSASQVAWITIRRDRFPQYTTICGSVGDPAAAALARTRADGLARFVTQPTGGTYAFACEGRDVNMATMNFGFLIVAAAVGWMVLFLLFRRFATEIHTEFDKTAGTVTIRTRAWFSRRTFTRPLRELTGIGVVRRRARSRWAYLEVLARFRDGTSEVIWSPAAVTGSTLTRTLERLSGSLGLRAPAP